MIGVRHAARELAIRVHLRDVTPGATVAYRRRGGMPVAAHPSEAYRNNYGHTINEPGVVIERVGRVSGQWQNERYAVGYDNRPNDLRQIRRAISLERTFRRVATPVVAAGLAMASYFAINNVVDGGTCRDGDGRMAMTDGAKDRFTEEFDKRAKVLGIIPRAFDASGRPVYDHPNGITPLETLHMQDNYRWGMSHLVNLDRCQVPVADGGETDGYSIDSAAQSAYQNMDDMLEIIDRRIKASAGSLTGGA